MLKLSARVVNKLAKYEREDKQVEFERAYHKAVRNVRVDRKRTRRERVGVAA